MSCTPFTRYGPILYYTRIRNKHSSGFFFFYYVFKFFTYFLDINDERRRVSVRAPDRQSPHNWLSSRGRAPHTHTRARARPTHNIIIPSIRVHGQCRLKHKTIHVHSTHTHTCVLFVIPDDTTGVRRHRRKGRLVVGLGRRTNRHPV